MPVDGNNGSISAELAAKREQLYARLRELLPQQANSGLAGGPGGRLLVAYSGGVDSAYLAWTAHRVLGNNMLAVLADSPSLARWQMQDAMAFAAEQGIPLEIIHTGEMDS